MRGNIIDEIINHENKFWSKIFQKELRRDSDERLFSSYWWDQYYQEMKSVIDEYLPIDKINSILEVGGGSGKASYLLNSSAEITILDISSSALEYAKYLAKKLKLSNNINYVEENAFDLSKLDEDYQLVWSIGLLEHYSSREIVELLVQQIAKVQAGGFIIIGVPNFWSGPTLKAYVLKYLRFFPGYRLDTERFYSDDEVRMFAKDASKLVKRDVSLQGVEYCGNYLPMETPKQILNFASNFYHLFKNNRFLKLYIYQVN